MTDFLDSLLARGSGTECTVLPRVPCRFEPMPMPSRRLRQDAFALIEDNDSATNELPLDGFSDPTPGYVAASYRSSLRQHDVSPGTDGPIATYSSGTDIREQSQQGDSASLEPIATIVFDEVAAQASDDLRGDDGSTFFRRQIKGLANELELLRLGLAHGKSESARPSGDAIQLQVQGDVSRTFAGHGEVSSPRSWPRLESNPKAVDEKPVATIPSIPESPHTLAPPVVPRIVPSPSIAMPIVPSAAPPRIVPERVPTSSRGSTATTPTVNVTIGRVEVKAVREAPPPHVQQPRDSGSKVMTLEQYLKRRSGGGE